jgi:hypothetical protein
MLEYYYIYGTMGMRSNGSFTRDKKKWITFNSIDVQNLGNNKPHGATKTGVFVLCSKFW